MLDKIFPKIHSEGYKFIVISILVTLFLLLFSKFLGILAIFITIWIYYFFRDPEKVAIDNDEYLVSPADGLITDISEVDGPKDLNLQNQKFTRVSIFMNVFNCHVNRSPCSGTVNDIFYKPGKFFNASLDKASEENEKNYIKFKSTNGEDVITAQIAGLIARRIVCECKNNDNIKQGDKIGMIRFGSRVDLYFKKYNILVKKNQTAIAGETLIAKL